MRRKLLGIALLVIGCGRHAATLPLEPPPGWSPVKWTNESPWSEQEARTVSAALFLVWKSLPPDDARRELLLHGRYLPLEKLPAEDGPRPTDAVALFNTRTGNVYVKRPSAGEFIELASSLAHELHHMEKDRTPSVNRMQECDRERQAHAREAEDVKRMGATLREEFTADAGQLAALRLAESKARSLSALYNSKFELFRLVQRLDSVEGLKAQARLYKLYERTIELAEQALTTNHAEELTLLDELEQEARTLGIEIGAQPGAVRAALSRCAELDREVKLSRP